MIKNIVFDIGNVMATFRPKEFLSDFFKDGQLAEGLYRIWFESNAWNRYDQGLIHGKDLIEMAGKNYPDRLHQIESMFPAWAKHVVDIPSSVALMEQLKEQGYGIYILSNLPEDSYEDIVNRDTWIKMIDGGIFSYQDRLIKPDPAIFRLLLDRYDLKAGECLFIDDRKENVLAARKTGYHTIHCTDPNELPDQVKGVLHEMQCQ